MHMHVHFTRVVLSTLDGPELAEDKNNRSEMYMHAQVLQGHLIKMLILGVRPRPMRLPEGQYEGNNTPTKY